MQSRALDLVKVNSADIKLKIKELSNAMYKSLGTAASINPYSSNYPGSSSAASPTPASSEPSPRPPTPESPPSSPAPKEKRKEKSKGRGADQEDEDDEESAKEKPKGKAKPKKKPPAKERIIIPPDTSPAMGRSRVSGNKKITDEIVFLYLRYGEIFGPYINIRSVYSVSHYSLSTPAGIPLPLKERIMGLNPGSVTCPP